MHRSTTSSPSLDRPGHGSCFSTATPMHAVDPRARQIINDAHELFQFNQLPALHDNRARLLFSMFNYACASTEGAQLKFSYLVSKMYVKSNGDKDVAFDEQFSNLEDLTAAN